MAQIRLRNITSGMAKVGSLVKVNPVNKKSFVYVTDLSALDVIGTVATNTPPGGMTTITLLGNATGTFSGTMDDISNGSIYVKTENNLTDTLVAEINPTFETVCKNLKGKPYAITYNGDDIDYITYNIGGGHNIIKTFHYTLGILTSIVLSGDTPAGIELIKTLSYTGDALTSVTYS